MDTKSNLDAYAENYSTYKGMNEYQAEYSLKYYSRYLLWDRPDSSCLELGCADGRMTMELMKKFKRVVAVDGSKVFLNTLRQKLRQQPEGERVRCLESYFEDLELDEKFDTITMGHILEHVADPVDILKKYKAHLKPDGYLVADVPNARSLHRLAAQKMGLIKSIYDLNETDLAVGHQRVYDLTTFRRDILAAGLKIVEETGFWLKVLSNRQIEEQWSEETIRAYMDLDGFEGLLPYAANILIVCSL